MDFFGLKKGQDLEDRAAHVYARQEFPGVPEGGGGGSKNKRKRFNASASFLTVLGALTCPFSLTTSAAITMQEREQTQKSLIIDKSFGNLLSCIYDIHIIM